MRCLVCNSTDSRVIDTRLSEDGMSIRRRRMCEKCGRRYTTYERMEMIPVMVIKKDLTREHFDTNKIRMGIIKACEKRNVSLEQIEGIVQDVENKVHQLEENEITSTAIGELVMESLREVDDVAYVRFASVYREFKDIQTFMDELGKLLTDAGKR